MIVVLFADVSLLPPQPHSFDLASIHQSGRLCCVWFPLIVPVMIDRDERILVHFFVEISITVGTFNQVLTKLDEK